MDDARTLFQLGIDLEEPSNSHTEDGTKQDVLYEAVPRAPETSSDCDGADRKDFFVEGDGERYAGTHLIIDLWGAKRIDDIGFVEETLRECVEAAGATLLHIHLHHFTPNDGISGVAVLAESHISIHSWPECGYAALDVFMCGAAEPRKAVEVMRERFAPDEVRVTEHRRGEGL